MRPLSRFRPRVVPLARGRVLEVGIGTGLNLAHYGQGVDRVDGVEPDPHMRRRCRARLESVSVPVQLHAVGAEALPFDAETFDDVVCTFALCTIPDPASALREVHRVLRPGGRLLFAEHVVSRHGPARALQHALDPLWTRLAGGCHLTRCAASLVRDAGFVIEETERWGGWLQLTPVAVGVARRCQQPSGAGASPSGRDTHAAP